MNDLRPIRDDVRRLGRVPLAAACGAAGLVYGAILDYSTWVTFSGVHTLGSYLAFSATSLSFNLAHAIGHQGVD